MPEIIEANGLRFGYHTLGEGPLLMLLHGFPDTARAWDPILAPLAAAGYRVVAPYLRGYSPTEAPATDTTTDELGQDVVGLIDAFGEDRAIVVGHDWGAAAAYAAASLAPDRVRRLIAVALAHPAGFKPGLRDMWAARHFATFRRATAPRKFIAHDFRGLRSIYRRWSPQWQFAESDLADIKRCLSSPTSREAIFGYYRAVARKPSPLLRRRIEVPTTAIAGESDGALRVGVFAEAAVRFNGPYNVVTMPGGHFPHREHPELFLEHLLAALDSPEPRNETETQR
jgi:pimeloyl-ACP methyl ester carboxylesterase